MKLIREFIAEQWRKLQLIHWSNLKQPRYLWLLGAICVGLLARAPGIFWGANFPTGWFGHHVDEYSHLVNAEKLINPAAPPRWEHPYPKGLAAHVAVPIIALDLVRGKYPQTPPTPGKIMIAGRAIGVLYGTATILLVFLFARLLFRDARVADLAAWLLALGGLHVSQSHFFVSDVPSLFWFLLGSYLLFLDLKKMDQPNIMGLSLAAACLGISFGLKLGIFGLPSLALVALMRPPRATRAIQVGAFFFAGFMLVNFASYTPYDIWKTLSTGISDTDYQFSWPSSLMLYLIELPSIISFPLTILALGGGLLLIRKFVAMRADARFVPIVLVVVAPLAINAYFALFKFDHFARHLVPFIPWLVIAAGWGLVKMIDRLASRQRLGRLVVALVFLYLAVFVFDGEKVFFQEPRNQAARWLLDNVPASTHVAWVYHNWLPGYVIVGFPEQERPPVLVMEMHYANHFLSGMGLKNSYPTEAKFIFDGQSNERVKTLQAVFRGESEYREVARFREGYVMPEYILVDHLIGNRSRNYVAEIVIFTKPPEQ